MEGLFYKKGVLLIFMSSNRFQCFSVCEVCFAKLHHIYQYFLCFIGKI